jgi:hypothetical protein
MLIMVSSPFIYKQPRQGWLAVRKTQSYFVLLTLLLSLVQESAELLAIPHRRPGAGRRRFTTAKLVTQRLQCRKTPDPSFRWDDEQERMAFPQDAH